MQSRRNRINNAQHRDTSNTKSKVIEGDGEGGGMGLGTAACSRRLAMKRSIDHRFKSNSSPTTPNALAAYPDSSSLPDHTYTCVTPDSVESPVPPCRPSLTPQDDLPPPKSRRPSSTGTGAEPSKEKALRKLTSKYTLLHQFKRPSAEALSARSSPSPHPHQTSSSTQPQTREQERVDTPKPLVDSPLPLPITPACRCSTSHHRSHSALDDTPASSPPSVSPGILRAHGHVATRRRLEQGPALSPRDRHRRHLLARASRGGHPVCAALHGRARARTRARVQRDAMGRASRWRGG
ncbi:hypothetical protein OF83DRAFT_1177184 [Amylostereum chailletii]|nr:hypothetical protein OF83DRAFT_1177184 [Amylostereum chailletii]